MESLPHFKYNPEALLHGIIRQATTVCPSCRQSREYVYDGPFYAEEEVDHLCPWCINDGTAARRFHGECIDAASLEDVSDENKTEELTKRTPGYTGWQQEQWLSHCDDYCAFKGYAGWKEIHPFLDELQEDLDQIMEDFGYDEEELKKNLVNGSGMQGYLFQCLHCGQHRLHVDTE